MYKKQLKLFWTCGKNERRKKTRTIYGNGRQAKDRIVIRGKQIQTIKDIVASGNQKIIKPRMSEFIMSDY